MALPDLGSTPTAGLLVSTLASGASIVSADVVLDGGQTLVGSFTVDGLTFAVNEEGVTLVSVDPSVILSGGTEGAGVEGSLSIPPSVSYDYTTYDVTAIGPYAFYLSGATSVELPATVADIDERTFRSSDVAWAGVDPANGTYASYDGAIYGADLTRLLLIPGGRQGAVRISDKAEGVDAPAFSHCAGVDAISVDAGSAHLTSWDGLLYDADGTTLLRVPAGVVDITIREGCTTIASGAMAGCAKLERINAPSTVTSISPDVFEDVPTVSLPFAALSSSKPKRQLSAIVALGSRSDPGVALLNTEDILVSVVDEESQTLWDALGVMSECVPVAEGSAQSATFGAGVYHYAKCYDGVKTFYSYNTYGSSTATFSNVADWVLVTTNRDNWMWSGTCLYIQTAGDYYLQIGFNGSYTGVTGVYWSDGGGTTRKAVAGQWYKASTYNYYTLQSLPYYTVSWDANGGTVEPAATSVYHNETTSAPLPVRAGHVFEGWYTSATEGTKVCGSATSGGTTPKITSARTYYAHWKYTYTIHFEGNADGEEIQPTDIPQDIAALQGQSITLPSASRKGYVFQGWSTSPDGGEGTFLRSGEAITNLTTDPGSTITLYAQWATSLSVSLPVLVTASVDKVGIDEQKEGKGYIESLCGEPLKVTDAEFEPLAGAATLFGTDTGSVSLVGFPDTSTTPLFTFALDTEGTESNTGALSPLAMASYGTRIPIRYRFDIPDELLPTLTETTLPVCQVSYTVALA